jgi:hypothetical protein
VVSLVSCCSHTDALGVRAVTFVFCYLYADTVGFER